jgi:hypothetical protein
MIRRLSLALAISTTCVLWFAAIAEAAPTSLVLSQSAAFSILGHWCGGIQEKVYATGWNATTGDPVGDVYMSTRCGGGGRGGGGSTTYSAWADVTWGFDGSTVSDSMLSSTPIVNPTFTAYDAHGDHVYNQAVAGVVDGTQVYTQAYLIVLVPVVPTNVMVTRSGGQFQVSWKDDRTAPRALITSSTVTATPVNSTASAVTASVSGNDASALIGPLQPHTTYQITVASADAAGSSAASARVSIATGASTIPPGSPTGVSAYWTAPGSPGDTLVASWKAAPPGDSPTDEYQITIAGSDGGGTYTQTVSGSTLTATFAVNDIPDWTIEVRTHDAAGWGRWSAPYTLGGT